MPEAPARKRCLILTADAGFGHRSASNAIQAALIEQGVREDDVAIVNVFDHRLVPSVMRDGQADYDRIVRDAPRLYEFTYNASELAVSDLILASSLAGLFFAPLRDIAQDFAPDVVISTYPLYQNALVALKRLRQLNAPTVCVVTDLISVHRIWFERGIDLYCVPTDEVRDLALDHRVQADRIRVTGIPVNPQLGRASDSKEALRASLGWRADRTTLFAVGSKRVLRLPDMLRGLNHSGLPIQLIMSAGKNDELYAELNATEWHVPARVYRFVSDMPRFLRASDAVMAKAGGLIVTETLAAGLPMLLTELIAGQETGNAEFVVKNGAGALAESPIEVLETMFDWTANGGAKLAQVAANAKRVGRPNAARDIASLALQLAAGGALPAGEDVQPDDQLELSRLRAFLKQFDIWSS